MIAARGARPVESGQTCRLLPRMPQALYLGVEDRRYIRRHRSCQWSYRKGQDILLLFLNWHQAN